ncbi:MAG: CHAP domain-containing protein [Mogibacterium sp.]|nr:CHAP domain-containing protein [Mogibacterium sp.]
MKYKGRILLAAMLAVCIATSPVYAAKTVRSQSAQAVETAVQQQTVQQEEPAADGQASDQTTQQPQQQAQEQTQANAQDTVQSAAQEPVKEEPAQEVNVPATAVITLSGAIYPANYSMGHEMSVGGTIESDVTLSRVEIGIVSDTTKNWVTGHKLDKKNMKVSSYNIANANSTLNFWTLPEGKYHYRIYAHASNGVIKLLANRGFTVTEATAEGSIEDLVLPATSEAGIVPEITGRIVCDVRMSRIEVGMVSAKTKNWVAGAKFDNNKLNTCQYDLSRALYAVAFDQLAPGEYYFRAYAHTKNGKVIVLINQPVRITGATVSSASIQNLVNIMDSQVGTKTGEKYWTYYFGTKFKNGDSTPWCGTFVAWCFDQAGLLEQIEEVEDYGNLGYVPSYTKFANKYDKWVEKAAAQAGDIIIFGSGSGAHVGIVKDGDGKQITTVEGNTGSTKNGEVKEKVYAITNSWIKGIIRVL